MDEKDMRRGGRRSLWNPLTRLQWRIAFGGVALGAITMIGAEYLDNGTVSAKAVAAIAGGVVAGFAIIVGVIWHVNTEDDNK